MEKDQVILTDHAILRAKERLSLNKKSLFRLAVKAIKSGITHAQTTGQLNKYITSIWGKNHAINNVRVYGEVVYLFDNNILVTLYQIPTEFRRILKHYR